MFRIWGLVNYTELDVGIPGISHIDVHIIIDNTLIHLDTHYIYTYSRYTIHIASIAGLLKVQTPDPIWTAGWVSLDPAYILNYESQNSYKSIEYFSF